MMKTADAEARSSWLWLDFGILAATLALCVWLWDSGGILGIAGCFCGAAISFNTRSMLNGAFAGLWVGIILGGLFGAEIGRLLDSAV